MSLHELHGTLQVAMGWEGIHLFQLSVRGVVHAGPYLCGQKVDLPLSDFRFRRNAKFSQESTAHLVHEIGGTLPFHLSIA